MYKRQRTAIRNGARHVPCYARRDESCISASEYEVSYAKLEGDDAEKDRAERLRTKSKEMCIRDRSW